MKYASNVLRKMLNTKYIVEVTIKFIIRDSKNFLIEWLYIC